MQKRQNRIILALLLALFLLPRPALAGEGQVDLPVRVKVTFEGGEGTSQVLVENKDGGPEVKNPKLSFEKTGEGTLDFLPGKKPGTYEYQIRQEGEDPTISYDQSLYKLVINLVEEGGEVKSSAHLEKEGRDGKFDEVSFVNKKKAGQDNTGKEEPGPQPDEVGDESTGERPSSTGLQKRSSTFSRRNVKTGVRGALSLLIILLLALLAYFLLKKKKREGEG